MNTQTLPQTAPDAATVNFYSDRKAATIVQRTDKLIVVREDKATLLNGMNSDAADKLIAHPGGFCAHVTGAQRYEYEPNPNGRLYAFTLRKNGRWVPKGAKMRGAAYSLTIGQRAHHYDFNF